MWEKVFLLFGGVCFPVSVENAQMGNESIGSRVLDEGFGEKKRSLVKRR